MFAKILQRRIEVFLVEKAYNKAIPPKTMKGLSWYKDQVTGEHIYDNPRDTKLNKPIGNKSNTLTTRIKPKKFSNALPAFSNSLPTFSNSVPGTKH